MVDGNYSEEVVSAWMLACIKCINQQLSQGATLCLLRVGNSVILVNFRRILTGRQLGRFDCCFFVYL